MDNESPMDFDPVDMMCEVVMEESQDDAPLNVPLPDEFTLPPIPTFDLQSEQFTYLAQPIVPQPAPPAKPILPAMKSYPPPGVSKPLPTTSKISILSVEQLNRTPETLNKTSESLNRKSETLNKTDVDDFDEMKKKYEDKMMRIWDRPSFRKVFSHPDKYPKNLLQVSPDEMKYYSEHFLVLSEIRFCKLHCTSCQKHIGLNKSMMKQHRMLAVLSCDKCYKFYGDGEFPKDKSDNSEIYCRWCGQGGEQVCCSFCPKVFCMKCVKNNFGAAYLEKIQDVSDWACFCCAQMPLWPLRAICKALLAYARNEPNPLPEACCKKRKPKKPILSPTPIAPKNMIVFHERPTLTQPPRPRAVRPRVQIMPRPQIVFQPRRAVAPTQVFSPRIQLPLVPKPRQPSGNKPAEVTINHSVADNMLVRLRMPNDNEQYLRINAIGTCMRIPNVPSNGSVANEALIHAFHAHQSSFWQVMHAWKLLEKGTPVQVQQELLKTFKSLREAIDIMEMDLNKNFEIFNKKNGADDVIDLDDDEPFTWEYKRKYLSDPEVEIIDDSENSSKRKRTSSVGAPRKKQKMVNGINEEKDPLAIDDEGVKNDSDGSDTLSKNEVKSDEKTSKESGDEKSSKRRTRSSEKAKSPDDAKSTNGNVDENSSEDKIDEKESGENENSNITNSGENQDNDESSSKQDNVERSNSEEESSRLNEKLFVQSSKQDEAESSESSKQSEFESSESSKQDEAEKLLDTEKNNEDEDDRFEQSLLDEIDNEAFDENFIDGDALHDSSIAAN